MLPSILVGALSLALVAFAAGPTSGTQAVCDYLFAKYPNFLAYNPTGPNALKTLANASEWNSINTEYWNFANSLDYPSACTFMPQTAAQVSDAVRQLNNHPDAIFGIKGGGHNPAPGFSATDQGVLISLEPNMVTTTRTADGKHFNVGAGARWGSVYNVTGQTNQVVVGGRLNHIGVAGLTLGGGLSYYSSQYGLACDNVDEFEVVLANSSVVTANRDRNSELWWSLRGGGNQFGIVTNFKLQAHPAGQDGKVWGGIRVYDPSQHTKLFTAITNFIRTYPDHKAAVIPTFEFGLPVNVLNDIVGTILFMFYDGPEPSSAFDEINAIPHLIDTTATKSYYEQGMAAFNLEGLEYLGNSFRNDMFPNHANVTQQVEYFQYAYQATYDAAFKTGLIGLPELDIQLLGYVPQPVSVPVAQASVNQGGNALGLDPKDGDRYWIENNFVWTSPSCNDRCPQYSKNLSDSLLAYHKKTYPNVEPSNFKGTNPAYANYNPTFMNDAAPYQNPYATYPPANLARLQAAKKAYDPTGFFTNRQGGFKLPAGPAAV